MNVKQSLQIALRLSMLLPLIGCGTITSGRHSDVTIISNPPNAHVVVKDRKGKEVASANTPAVVNLQRGYYLMPAHYTACIEAPGYEPQKIDIPYTVNPWLWGNSVLGGPIGLVVDDTTGAMWKPKKETIAMNLAPDPDHQVAISPPAESPNPPVIMADNPTQQIGYQVPIARR